MLSSLNMFCGCADFALPFVPLVAVPRARCHERRRSEALPAAGEEKPELIAGLTPIAVDTCAPDEQHDARLCGSLVLLLLFR